ncbi:hypothetical protein SY88_03995 [Clostridiales bacterium PH28_bin88]|nr:hypothetical protein SY88_03995 [Clostridiales bacterium PH28_bin88]
MSKEEIERRAEALGMGYREQFLLLQPPPSSQLEGPEVEVNIPPGSTIQEIGEILARAGLADARDFASRVTEMGLSRQLRAGVYRIPRGAELDSIIKQLAR